MAKIMPYTDSRGNDYTGSYWRLVRFNVDVDNAYSNFSFKGYKDKDARLNNKDYIGIKDYEIKGGDFNYYMALELSGIQNTRQIFYEYASNCNTEPTSTYNIINSGTPDETVERVYRPFFSGAIDDL